MENIKKVKVKSWRKETGVSNMMNRQPFTVVDSYLIGAMEFLSFKVEICHVRCDMMCRTRVWIPIGVRTMGRSREIGLRELRGVSRGLVVAVVAIKGDMTHTVANLANRAR
jgi:hypothetical protein